MSPGQRALMACFYVLMLPCLVRRRSKTDRISTHAKRERHTFLPPPSALLYESFMKEEKTSFASVAN